MVCEPRCVFGIPTYNHARHVEASLRSILGQSHPDLRIVVCDDASSGGTQEILKALASEDPRLLVHLNEKRLGYIGNAQQTLVLAGRIFPEAEFFAWGSDHDLWHRDWLWRLVTALDAEREAVAAWPWFHRIDEGGTIVGSKAPSLGEGRSNNPLARLRFASHRLHAGSSIYGLYRRQALERVGGLKYVVDPDRALLAKLSLLGRFVLVEDHLWFRRYVGLACRARQRRSFFPGGTPWYAYTPRIWQHCWVLFRDVVVRGELRPEISRLVGFGAILAYVAQRRFRFAELLYRKTRRWLRQVRWFSRRMLKLICMILHRSAKRLRQVALAIPRRLGIV